MKNKINGLDLNNCLLYLKIILKKIDKISLFKDLVINNKLKVLETEKIDEFTKKIKVWNIKKQIFGKAK